MLGIKIGAERARSATGNNKRLSYQEINEIKCAIEIENSKAKRAGEIVKYLHKWFVFIVGVIVLQSMCYSFLSIYFI